MALLDNIIGLYRFNQDITGTCPDHSGNGKSLTISGPVVDASIKKLGSSSANFDGTNDRLSSTVAGFDGLTALSCSFWMYVASTGDYEHIISKGNLAAPIEQHSWGFMFMT